MVKVFQTLLRSFFENSHEARNMFANLPFVGTKWLKRVYNGL